MNQFKIFMNTAVLGWTNITCWRTHFVLTEKCIFWKVKKKEYIILRYFFFILKCFSYTCINIVQNRQRPWFFILLRYKMDILILKVKVNMDNINESYRNCNDILKKYLSNIFKHTLLQINIKWRFCFKLNIPVFQMQKPILLQMMIMLQNKILEAIHSIKMSRIKINKTIIFIRRNSYQLNKR